MSNSLISDRKINCSRQAELELLKAYPILFMIIIHVYKNLSVGRIDPTPRTCLEHVLQFLAGPATAPAYMFAMGVGIIYSGNNAPKLLFRRGLRLFLGGYALNAARSGILTALGTALTGRFDPELTKYLFLNMDILHFAGLALMMSSLLFWIKIKPLTIVGVSLILQLIGRRLAMLPEMTSDFSYIAGHFYKCTPAGCFPLMQWYIYPAFGILFGTVLRRVSDLKAWYRQLGLCSAVLLLCYVGTLAIFGFDMSPCYSLANDAFYNLSRFQRDVGIVAQTMLLTAVEMGLGGCLIGNFNAGSLHDAIGLVAHIRPLLIIAIGKPDEEVILTDVVNGKTGYYRDEQDRHYVPKRKLEDLVI